MYGYSFPSFSLLNDYVHPSKVLPQQNYDSGLSTVIGRPNKDASGRMLDAAMRSRMERLRKWDVRIKASNSLGNLKDALNQLQLLKDKLGLPETIVQKTTYIYRKAQVSGFVRGRTVPAVLGAALYIACRELGIPKTLKEIAQANNVKHKTLEKIYRKLITELDITSLRNVLSRFQTKLI